MAFSKDDFKYLYEHSGRKIKRYHLSCDGCGTSRGYGMKSRADLLCKVCTHKGNDYLRGKRSKEYSKKMSEIKRGCKTWNKGKTGIYSNEVLEKMRQARISQNPCGDLISTDQHRIKRRCLGYLLSQIRMWNRAQKGGDHCSSLFEFTFDEFVRDFELKFQDGMSWENHGEWHIDHIIPDSWFNYSGIEDTGFKESWALSNLQPLWAKDNLKKGNRFKG